MGTGNVKNKSSVLPFNLGIIQTSSSGTIQKIQKIFDAILDPTGVADRTAQRVAQLEQAEKDAKARSEVAGSLPSSKVSDAKFWHSSVGGKQ